MVDPALLFRGEVEEAERSDSVDIVVEGLGLLGDFPRFRNRDSMLREFAPLPVAVDDRGPDFRRLGDCR